MAENLVKKLMCEVMLRWNLQEPQQDQVRNCTGYELHTDKNFRGIIEESLNNCKFNHWQTAKKIVKYQYGQ